MSSGWEPTSEIEDRLRDIFGRKLDEIERRIETQIGPRWRHLGRLHEEWMDFLEGVPGLEVMGGIVAMVVDEKEGRVRFDNPLVVGGNPGMISVPKETAMKIVTLGHIPQKEKK